MSKRRPGIERSLGVVLLGVSCLLSGCPRTSGGDVDAAPGADASSDAAVPDPRPLRRLITRRLFGEAPLDNRVQDPNFTRIDGYGWTPICNYLVGQISKIVRVHQRTPRGQPALRLETNDHGCHGRVFGLVKGSPESLEASIWLGRPEGNALAELEVNLQGLWEEGTVGVDLQPEIDTMVTLDGVTWMRFSAIMQRGPIAWSLFNVVNDTETPLYLSSPIVRMAPSLLTAPGAGTRWSVPRPLTARERFRMRSFFRDLTQ